jgi:hypothetical protein
MQFHPGKKLGMVLRIPVKCILQLAELYLPASEKYRTSRGTHISEFRRKCVSTSSVQSVRLPESESHLAARTHRVRHDLILKSRRTLVRARGKPLEQADGDVVALKENASQR